jgi:hypothetical protein
MTGAHFSVTRYYCLRIAAENLEAEMRIDGPLPILEKAFLLLLAGSIISKDT